MALALVAGGAAGIACTLNPQPLPPDSFSAAGPSDNDNEKAGGTAADPKAPPNVADAGASADGGNQRADGGSDAEQTPGEGGTDGGVDAPLDGASDVTTGG
jgi:hypothetical protein